MSDLVQSPAANGQAPMVNKTAKSGDPRGGETDARQQTPLAKPDEAAIDSAAEGRREAAPAKPETSEETRAGGPKTGGDQEGSEEKQNEPKESVLTKLRKHWIVVSVAVIVLIGGAVGGSLWYWHSLNYASTDDAFIDGRPISINLQVMGTIVAVPVTDNQIVKVGDLLVQIDDRDYQATVDLAQAQIEQAQTSIIFPRKSSSKNHRSFKLPRK